MIFSEFYSAYYHAVTKILTKALESPMTESEMQALVLEYAFSESVLTIPPALKSGQWQLMHPDLTPILHHSPTRPLTLLEQRWLCAIQRDPRIALFDVSFPALSDAEPLFTPADYKIYDQYLDGDPFTDPTYIEHFRFILSAIREKRPVQLTMHNRHGKEIGVRCYPKGFEYSLKDDKIRIVADGCKFEHFNLGRVLTCTDYTGNGPWRQRPKPRRKKELLISITDERNALERVMLHFAHFEKQAERIDDTHYRLRLFYLQNDETELVIRILSFGPYIEVIAPQSFRKLIQNRLRAQKRCELP